MVSTIKKKCTKNIQTSPTRRFCTDLGNKTKKFCKNFTSINSNGIVINGNKEGTICNREHNHGTFTGKMYLKLHSAENEGH